MAWGGWGLEETRRLQAGEFGGWETGGWDLGCRNEERPEIVKMAEMQDTCRICHMCKAPYLILVFKLLSPRLLL